MLQNYFKRSTIKFANSAMSLSSTSCNGMFNAGTKSREN